MKHNLDGKQSSSIWSSNFYYVSKKIERGNHIGENNPMRWNIIISNWPGNKRYNPVYPRVIKWDLINRRLASDCKTYVDDVRFTCEDLEHAWKCDRWMMSKAQDKNFNMLQKKTKSRQWHMVRLLIWYIRSVYNQYSSTI